MNYIAYLHKDSDSDYGVSFPDFPGCVTAGSTLEEARLMAIEALAFHIESMLEEGIILPEPSSLDDLSDDEAFKGAISVLVSVFPNAKTVRANLTIREDKLAEIDQAAHKAGMDRSTFMVTASLEKISNTHMHSAGMAYSVPSPLGALAGVGGVNAAKTAGTGGYVFDPISMSLGRDELIARTVNASVFRGLAEAIASATQNILHTSEGDELQIQSHTPTRERLFLNPNLGRFMEDTFSSPKTSRSKKGRSHTRVNE